MRRSAVLTVWLLLVLTGCNAVPGGGGTPAKRPANSSGRTS